MEKADLLFIHGYVLTMAGEGVGFINDGAVAVAGDSIAAVGDSGELLKRFAADRVIDASGKVLMPGLIDAHIHTGDCLIRGVSQDIRNWMQHGMWPFEQVLRPDTDALMKGSMLNILEAVKAGTTTFCDFYAPMNELVKNHVKIGTRARIAQTVNEMPKVNRTKVGELYEFDPAEGKRKMEETLRLFRDWHGRENGRITCMLGPQGADMCSREMLEEIRQLAEELDTSIHMHVAQGDREIDQMIKRYGKRTIEFLDEIGYLNERLIAVHLTEATEEETKYLASKGAGMVLCSGSIGIIDGIVPPAAAFLEVSSRLALGSDQAPGNNCNNMFNEMKFTAILNKCKAKDPTVFPAWKVLRMATAESAKAIGLGDQIGTLEAGKKADLIMVDMRQPALSPVILSPIRNIVPNLVYSARGNEVEMSVIDGRIVMENFKVLTVDEASVVREAQEAADRIAEQAADLFKGMEDTPLMQMMAAGKL
ncbi:MAG: amidohydrolase [Solobacterium sp.]|nr:amidohydrolase [Solobacterium sp.]